MRWPRLTRGGRSKAAPPGPENAYKPGSWGQPASPVLFPTEQGPVTAPTGNVALVAPPTQSAAPVVEQPPALVPPPVTPVASAPGAEATPSPVVRTSALPASASDEMATTSAVRLGFVDGSDLQLDPDHPHSLALRAVADVLLHRGTSRRQVS